MANYFVSDSRGDHGPSPPEQLPGQGVTPETLVWCEGMADWQKAATIPELAPHLVAPRQQTYAAPRQDLSNTSQFDASTVHYNTSIPAHGGAGMGIASMILGILSLVFSVGEFFSICCVFVGVPSAIIAFSLSITALILGFIALKNPNARGMGIAGIITGGVSILIIIAWVVIFFIIMAAAISGTAVPPPRMGR
jgi:hypothetical protein